ncbi:hypothetical protein TMES_16350 [Thalassospira mesophila]|uniref:Uncharacterized protein n=1 Tax=Thalassospira mesophila TaxID=1293891 RepID=A0A1Y2KY56_9PROT|nr:hypothetical protein TMES_16350 [Thalassospira mesophila]
MFLVCACWVRECVLTASGTTGKDQICIDAAFAAIPVVNGLSLVDIWGDGWGLASIRPIKLPIRTAMSAMIKAI